MECQFCSNRKKFDETSITPEKVRGLSLGKITESFGTIGLYTCLIDSLERNGFKDNELVQLSVQLGLALHADDERTNGHYTDHIMRVTLHMLDNFHIKDSDIIAAGPLHDAFEDHPRDLVFALTGEKPFDKDNARTIGREVLTRLTNDRVVEIVETVTNPPIPEGADKIEVYTKHIANLVQNSPTGRVLKLADFIENACGNHATIGKKQAELDNKYINQYRIHMMGLFMPDSIIVGQERQEALHQLSKGHARALGRLAMTERKSHPN